ncbi:MAG: DNA replication and repair protein RecF [Coriobacteriia bacterium]|nr:DNA replication and repair protein RecF [Coriobacteriia bacterium]
MPNAVTHVDLRDFRNYERLSLDLDPRTTIFVGPNGVGKTNVVEAVQLLLTAESFRKPAWEDVVRWRAGESVLSASVEGDTGRTDITARITERRSPSFSVNNKRLRRTRDVADVLPCVVFTPDDLQMVKGSAENRRSAIDGIGDRLSKTYRSLRQDYERTVRQRNRALKESAADSVLDVLTERAAETGARLVAHRLKLFERMRRASIASYGVISDGQPLGVEYVSEWLPNGDEGSETTASDAARALREALEERAAEERGRGMTLAGPHRDDLVFLVEDRDSRVFGSQGQQRSIALAWKLAEVDVVDAVAGKAPALLLDDVMSELDRGRRRALATFVGTRTQTLATTTNLDYFEQETLEQATVVRLER